MKNGSNAVINYFSNGSKKYSKERVEVFSQDRTWIVDNYKITKSYGVNGFKTIKSKIDKGHNHQFNEYIKKIESSGNTLIPFSEIVNVSFATFAAIKSLKMGKWINIDKEYMNK